MEGFEYDEDWNYQNIPVSKDASGKSGKDKDEESKYPYSIARLKVNPSENLNIVNGYSKVITSVSDGLKTGKIKENELEAMFSGKMNFNDYLNLLGYR